MPNSQEQGKCENCKYFDRKGSNDPNDPRGRCLRYAPHPQVKSDDVIWPKVPKDAWCGEYDQRIEKPSPAQMKEIVNEQMDRLYSS